MDFLEFQNKVSNKINVDLSSYKRNRVERRINNLMKKHNLSDYRSCLEKLNTSHDFQEEFLEHMTINTSEFYRNPKNYEYLQDKLFPELFANKSKIKIWSAASSNGCEAYTLAIILNELGIDPSKYQIKATDIDPAILQEARAGKYKENSLKKVPEKVLNKYFTKKDDYYQLDRKIMSRVQFGRLDLLKDRYDTNIDLILCRNVFIYFTKEIKDQLTKKLSNSLVNGGILFLGNTEYLLKPEEFNLNKIYNSFYRRK
ncbi:chemotaxis protein methyltransferase CheR [Orenia metallireducens]|jgi:chemotaxis protein methyltransferase CheR|uniref:protein-glutamate O-methyltransferase n=1 Tax=Orenia metallireducens TaxID=1413210 RepID=A0A285G159_9FIRM|nr:protein-glutamate O-methyltransferase CheR [Orenia metallireducens]PRX31754.1 chemotaxis protein methyltransferase CheR [Orenia metallireducens]SNY17083.1 chemotaxis protein methyltransferase CheR [Orenia metallireducens]